MPYEINHEKFTVGPSLVEIFQSAKEAPMPKLNVRIHKSDLRILDSISRQSGAPRSQILNSMIESVIGAMLHDLAKDNMDCCALVAKHADDIAGIDHMNRGSWSDMLFYSLGEDQNNYYGQGLDQKTRDGGLTQEYQTLVERFSRDNV